MSEGLGNRELDIEPNDERGRGRSRFCLLTRCRADGAVLVVEFHVCIRRKGGAS